MFFRYLASVLHTSQQLYKKLYCVGCRVLSASYDFMSKQVVKKQTIFNFHNYSFILHTLHQKLIYFQWYTLLFIGLMQQTMNVHILTGWIAEQLKKLFGQQGLQLPILHCLSLGLDFDVLIYILSLAALTNYFNIHDMPFL